MFFLLCRAKSNSEDVQPEGKAAAGCAATPDAAPPLHTAPGSRSKMAAPAFPLVWRREERAKGRKRALLRMHTDQD